MWTRHLVVALVAVCVSTAAFCEARTGLRPHSPEEEAWMREQFPEIRRIRLNGLGLERLNAERRAKGMRALGGGEAGAVEDGRELIFAPDDGDGYLPPLPSDVDNSRLPTFPPVGNQGPLGSCAAWAVAYYQLTFEVATMLGWDARSGGHRYRFSPKWVYNMVNGGEDRGSTFAATYELLLRNGAATLAEFPYDHNYLEWSGSRDVWRNALRFRLPGSRGIIPNASNDEGISAIKIQLANGHLVTFGTYVRSWQNITIADDPSTSLDDEFVGQVACRYVYGAQGAHAMTFVGYNDHIWVDINRNGVVDRGERGAFKVANSWGTGEGNDGFRWVAYDSLRTVSLVPGAPFPRSTLVSPSLGGPYTMTAEFREPAVTAEFTLSSASRQDVSVMLGVSNGGEAPAVQWYSGTLRRSGGPHGFAGTDSEEQATFVLDFTDAIETFGGLGRMWLVASDAKEGDPLTIHSFRVIDYQGRSFDAQVEWPLVVDASTARIPIDISWDGPLVRGERYVLRDGAILEKPAREGVLANVYLPVGWTASVELVADARQGRLTLFPDGAFRYEPGPDFTGTDSFTYAVLSGGVARAEAVAVITAATVNRVPRATVSRYQTESGASIHVSAADGVLANDHDPDGDKLTARLLSSARHGALDFRADGSFAYHPDSGFEGLDSFKYEARDGALSSGAVNVLIVVGSVPPVVKILSPVDGDYICEGYERGLRCSILDFNIDANHSVTWRSDTDGLIAEGAETAVRGLSPGLHRISVAVSDGRSETTEFVSLEVRRDTDSDGIPDYWEAMHGLDAEYAGDASREAGDGVTYLDHYRSGTAPPAALGGGCAPGASPGVAEGLMALLAAVLLRRVSPHPERRRSSG